MVYHSGSLIVKEEIMDTKKFKVIIVEDVKLELS